MHRTIVCFNHSYFPYIDVVSTRNKSASLSQAEEGKGKKIAEYFSTKRNSALLLRKERRRRKNALKIAYWFLFSFALVLPMGLEKVVSFCGRQRVIMHHVLNQYVKEGEPSM